jgi:hypothetical protein
MMETLQLSVNVVQFRYTRENNIVICISGNSLLVISFYLYCLNQWESLYENIMLKLKKKELWAILNLLLKKM